MKPHGVRQNGRLRHYGDKKVDNNKKDTVLLVGIKGFRLWKQDFERQIYKNVRGNHKKQPSNMDKVQEKMCPRKEKKMFEKFGEMGSYKEINELAENLRQEGDTDSLRAMAEENGIPSDFAEMYLDGMIPELCDPVTAAIGKLDAECRELKPQEIMEDWVEYIKGLCMEHEEAALQVRAKGKSLKGCIAELLKWSFRHMKDVDKEILKAAGVSGKVSLGIPGMGQAKKLIRDYYGGRK